MYRVVISYNYTYVFITSTFIKNIKKQLSLTPTFIKNIGIVVGM